ncbi:MAG: ATP-dependent DNA helicase RecG [Gammaproteobacteria bacterium]|nr:ATP-dependent DNA helicase RecG [Gammaproteobacteria bacterium]MBT5602565.1 ATP-dependent DNA helicase RecG [Gammaproteobacteria bacterium]MBT6245846.1 ATP-dependent DNA helicase RecG [Gammaproteobacteria bacterium]
MAKTLAEVSVATLKGVGPAMLKKLEQLSILNLQDLLLHLPLRYENRTRITAIADALPGDHVVLKGQVVNTQIQFGRRRSLIATLRDETGQINLRFYYFGKTQQAQLELLPEIRCFGEIRRGATGLELYHPEYSKQLRQPLETTLTPVYPATEGISQKQIRKLVLQALTTLQQGDLLPDLISRSGQPVITDSLVHLHQPFANSDLNQLSEGLDPAQRALSFEELTAHQTGILFMREKLVQLPAAQFQKPSNLVDQFIKGLNFTLTQAQLRVAEEISQDLQKGSPTLRLLQGDVGSGKTVIAALAAVQASENGFQAALMVPTEILAEQHYLTLKTWLEPLNITIDWLSGSIKGNTRSQLLEDLSSGKLQIIVGTHALFQDQVIFHQLGLAIIDEQHRFGVHQRMALRDKGEKQGFMPHQLIMTATPIPRTLTMSLYGDMDCSIIDELPAGRTPITTRVIPGSRRTEIIDRLKQACASGAQAYWVCTLIESSETLSAEAAEDTAQQLEKALHPLVVGLVHGRMSGQQKAQIMEKFSAGEIQVLVATTVIEVGVDIANASFMVIENAERLGLTQLHQLRGRVGRGRAKSFCLLLYATPLGETSKQRLNVMRQSQDGFFIAEQDLMIRGPGDVLGDRQSGNVNFKIADLIRDQDMLDEAVALAQSIFSQDNTIAKALVQRWIGSVSDYGQV